MQSFLHANRAMTTPMTMMMSMVAVLTSLHYVMVASVAVVIQLKDLRVCEAVMRTTLVMVSCATVFVDRPLHWRMQPLTRNRPKFDGAADFARGQDSMGQSLVAVDRFVVIVARDRDGRTFASVAVPFLAERPMHFRFLERQIERASNRGKSEEVNGDVVQGVADPLGRCK